MLLLRKFTTPKIMPSEGGGYKRNKHRKYYLLWTGIPVPDYTSHNSTASPSDFSGSRTGMNSCAKYP
jgi:hypothetical protein